MSKLLVSIVTPSFNQGDFIDDCIQSIKNQTYDNIEHIIIDACSTDNTKEILDKHKGTYNLKFLIEPDSGPANAINKGFNLAKGDLFCWLNSDDYYLHKEVIQTVINYFEKYKTIDLVTGCGYKVDSSGKWIEPIINRHEKITKNRIRYEDSMLQPSTFWKKEVHVHLNEKLKYVFDWILFLQFFKNGANVLSVYDYLSAYRIHDLSRTYIDNSDRKKEIANVLKVNFGAFSIQYFWGFYMYLLYKLSDVTSFGIFKRFAILSNMMMNKISVGRIVSY